jgi:spermidine synthase
MNRLAIYAIFTLSGVAGLGYELLWTRWLAVGLGHEYPATLAVIAGFFGGLALGAAALDGRIARSARPAAWYAGCEIVIGAWALALTVLAPASAGWFARVLGPSPTPAWQWMVSFAGPLLLFLPATFAMGATLPAVDAWMAHRAGHGRRVGGLYAANTFGAVAGILITTNILLPLVGIRAGVLILAGMNFFCAAAAWLVDRPGAEPPADLKKKLRLATSPSADPARLRLTLLRTLFLTGLLGVGYEVLAIRVLGQVLEDTVFTFAAALSVYLLGTAAGAALYQAMIDDRRPETAGSATPPGPTAPSQPASPPAPPNDPLQTPTRLLLAQCAVILLTLPLLSRAGVIYDKARDGLGGGVAAALIAEHLVAAIALWLPTLLMGATFSALAQAARGLWFGSTGAHAANADDRRAPGLGRALAWNTLGGAVAPALFGVLLLPAIGSKASLVLLGFAYAAVAPRRNWGVLSVAAAAALLVYLVPFDLRLIMPRPGQRVVASVEGVQSTASVIDEAGDRLLKVNRSFCMGGAGRGAFAQLRMGHLPLLRHAKPRKALFLGLGTGITFAAAGCYPALQADGVELAPEVVELLPWFESRNAAIRDNPRLRTYVADARRFVRASDEAYDVIVADLFHPARDGAALLYTREHFEAISRRLADGGVFCQWLPLYQLDSDAFRLIVRTFAAVFPDADVILAYYNAGTPVLGLITRAGPGPADPVQPESDTCAAAGLNRAVDIDGATLSTLQSLRTWAGDGPLNTDDHPRLAFAAVRRAYLNSNPGWENLAVLMALPRPGKAELWPDVPPGRQAAAEAYAAARDAYLRGLHAWSMGDLPAAERELRAADAADAGFTAARPALELLRRGGKPGG